MSKQKSTLILGDSNTECSFNDSIFSSSINKSASADSYFYSYLKLKYFINVNTNIDTVLLSFAPHNIFDNEWLFESNNFAYKLQIYFPIMDMQEYKFLLSHKPLSIVKNIPSIMKRSIWNVYGKMRNQEIKCYNGQFLSLKRFMLKEALLKLKKGEPFQFFKIPENFNISSYEVQYLKKIIDLCKKNNIKLYLVNTPKRNEIVNHPKYGTKKFYEYYDTYLKQISFIDFSKYELPDSCYGDLIHLNAYGATTFSKLFLDGIDNVYLSYKR